MSAVLWIPLLAPILVAALSVLTDWSPLRRLAGVIVSIIVLLSGVALVIAVMQGQVPTSAGGALRADALSAYMLTVVGAVGLVSNWGGLKGRSAEEEKDSGPYAALISLFLGAMSLAVLADNLGAMWVAIEATTIATAFLVGHHRTRRSLEAAWKYVILGSVGIAIAFLGIVLLYAASNAAGTPTLSWLVLDHTHLALDPALVKVGGALAVLGLATKAGLSPMHSWLPDAHSQAPAPVSGLMSGVLLSVALYAILRIQAITDSVLGVEFMRTLLSAGGLLSLAIAAALLLRQRDYKRMLAYSSIEHMGMMALGAAVGPSALPAVLLYILGHGLIKSSLFVISGRILAVEGTSHIADIRGLLTRRPGLAIPWLVGMIALLGFPPFSIFFSEVGIVIAGWAAGMAAVMAVALLLMLVIFAGLTRLTATMVFGPGGNSAANSNPVVSDPSGHGPLLPLILGLGTAAVLAFVATPIGSLLAAAAAALGGTR
ncbi:MAG: proton-conducting transporter transmembrane domain-containing protein [Lacisediminihabitans sp.]